MAKPLIVSIPHNLGKEEALRRIRSGIGQARTQFASHLAVLDENWMGDHLDFRVAALKQEAAGSIDVGQDAVTLTITLPWMLAVLAEKARALISRQGTLLLEKK